jgi:hypothetical protein
VPVPGAVALKFDQPLELDARSNPIKDGDRDFSLIGIGRGTFHLADDGHLTAKLNAAVFQHARVDYWIYATVFDEKGKVLGTSSHKEEVQYIRLGREPMMFREIDLDFGISKGFARAAYVVVAIGERDMPDPLSGKR